MNASHRLNLLAEVVSIGDEMTSGSRLDTNARWLSQRLGALGVAVAFHTTVGDTLEHNVEVFRIAAQRADVVVSTGGLGPTRDDLTREALAAVSGTALELRESALQHIRSLFASRKREMPARNEIQAMFPGGSREIFNPQGTAPGIDLAIDRGEAAECRIFALPGVPAEMTSMFDQTVASRILEMTVGPQHLQHQVLKFFGVGESDMEQRLGEMLARDREPRVGITVSAATISLRITARGDSIELCRRRIAETRAEIMQRVGELYFGEGEEFEQQHAIDAQLRQRGEALMLVELGRAAPLGDWFAALGETPAFRGGISLGNESDLLELTGCESAKDALESLRRQFKADWLLYVDRYPALDHDSERPIPAFDVKIAALRGAGQWYPTHVTLGGHPSIVQHRIAKSSMSWLRRIINS